MDVGLIYAVPILILAVCYWTFIVGLTLMMLFYGVVLTYAGIRESNAPGTFFGLCCFGVCACLIDVFIARRK